MIIAAILSLIFSLGLILLAVFLFYSTLQLKPNIKESANPALDDSNEPARAVSLGTVSASRWLILFRLGFLLLCLTVLGFHGYWAFFAAGPLGKDEDYMKLRDARDQRNRRIQEAGLRGWVLDRHNSLDSPLIRYSVAGAKIVRDYPLDDAAAHLTGYRDLARGSSGIETAFNKLLTTPVSTYNAAISTVPVGTDLVTTIDADLQRIAATQLAGKRGAVVVIDVKTGGILAMASSPTFSPKSNNIADDATWQKISTDRMNQPLVNRATNQYYLPGSSFKTVVAAAALANGLDKEVFVCTEQGFTAPGSSRPIPDDLNSVHGRIDFQHAFAVSCNQYFAQLGLKLGAARLAETARNFGIHIDDSPEKAREFLVDDKAWNSNLKDLSDALGPKASRVMMGKKTSSYDLAIQSIGQGFTQMTPMQMAMIAATVANNGRLMQPKLEENQEPKLRSVAMTPQVAIQLREIMQGVVKNGTARAAFAGSTVSVAGKTGTAQREVTVYDPKTHEPVMITTTEGKKYAKTELSIDAWFIGFAPVENPQIAFAVIVENGGHGGAVAAPIARVVVENAAKLGIIGGGNEKLEVGSRK